MTGARITYTPHADATPEAELATLTTCYSYILDLKAKTETTKPAPEPSSRDDLARVRDEKEVNV